MNQPLRENLLRAKGYFIRSCERYEVELELSPAFEEPEEEIRNVMHMWLLCNIECGVIMHMLKLQEFRSRYSASIWEDREGFLKEVMFELGWEG